MACSMVTKNAIFKQFEESDYKSIYEMLKPIGIKAAFEHINSWADFYNTKVDYVVQLLTEAKDVEFKFLSISMKKINKDIKDMKAEQEHICQQIGKAIVNNKPVDEYLQPSYDGLDGSIKMLEKDRHKIVQQYTDNRRKADEMIERFRNNEY